MIKEVFYYFPQRQKQPPFILYKNKYVLKSKIFGILYSKMGANTWKLRLRKNIVFSALLELVLGWRIKTYETIVDKSVKLIYIGYDNEIHFSFNSNMEVNHIFKKKNNYNKEKFLGYSLNIFDYENLLNSQELLINFFKKHWKDLKTGNRHIHGDLVPSNICISNYTISLIDEKNDYCDSIIFDHLYFYCYSMSTIDSRNNLSVDIKNQIIIIINNIFRSVFKKDELTEVAILIESLELKKLPFENFNSFKNLFYSEIIQHKTSEVNDK